MAVTALHVPSLKEEISLSVASGREVVASPG